MSPPTPHPHPSLLAQLREDWIAHARVFSPSFRVIAVYRFGVWRMTVKSKLLRAPLSFLYRRLASRMHRSWGVELPYTAQLGRRVIIQHVGGIVIGSGAIIGDDSAIFQGVTLGIRHGNHGPGYPTIGKHVILGAGAKLLGPIHIGDHARIGANAVVLSDVPPHATAVGIPAKVISRSPPTSPPPHTSH